MIHAGSRLTCDIGAEGPRPVRRRVHLSASDNNGNRADVLAAFQRGAALNKSANVVTSCGGGAKIKKKPGVDPELLSGAFIPFDHGSSWSVRCRAVGAGRTDCGGGGTRGHLSSGRRRLKAA